MKKYMKYITIYLLMFGLTSCASYTPPTSGPIATIRNEKMGMLTGIFQNSQECTDLQVFSFGSNFAFSPTKLSAGKVNTLLVQFSDYMAECPDIVFSFTPKTNNDYRVSYSREGMKGCVFYISNLTTKEPVQVIRRDYQKNIWSGKGSCKDKLD